MTTTNRIYSIDTMRCVAAFLVVTLHVSMPIPYINNLLPDIARIAVPFFLLCSGFFLYSSDRQHLVQNINRSIIKCLKLLAIVIFGYFVIDIICWWNIQRVIEQLKLFVSWDFWFFNTTPFCPVAWYLMAYIYSLLLIKLIVKVFKYEKSFWIVCAVLILIGFVYWLITGVYQAVFYGSSNYFPWENNCCWISAYPFVMIGMIVKRYYGYTQYVNIKNACLVTSIVFFSISTIVAHFVIKRFTGHSVNGTGYISTIPLVLCVFILLLKNPLWGRKSIFYTIGNMYSLYIYLWHVAVNYLLCRLFLVKFDFEHYFSFEPLVKIPFHYAWIVNAVTVFIITATITHLYFIIRKK